MFYGKNGNQKYMIKIVNIRTHNAGGDDVYIGRGSILGNPYTSIKHKETKADFVCDSREESIKLFREYLNDKISNKDSKICAELNKIYLKALSGNVNLMCYCSPKECHGDVIKEIIDSKILLKALS